MSTPAAARAQGPRFLDAGDVARAWSAARELSRECEDWTRWAAQPPTISGWWGGALLVLTYHNRLERSDERAGVIGDLLDMALPVASRVRAPGFYGGLSGIGWGMEHVSRLLGDECELDDLDEWLLSVIGREMIADPELINGLSGIGVYGLERVRHERCRQLVTRIVLTLERDARLQIDGLAWHKPPQSLMEWQREQLPNGCFNLGLSHGVPGVVSFLCRAVQEDVCADVAAHLLDQSVPWLIRRYIRAGSAWRVASVVEGAPPEKPRLAWCYNELGTTMPILAAARTLGRDDWLDFGGEVLRALSSIDVADSGVWKNGDVRDTAVCHGMAGIAHLFAHGARLLDDASLAAVARRWMKALLDARSSEHGVAGFPGLGLPDRQTGARPVTNEPGFLEGATGAGLVLLAALADEAPGWSRILGL